MADPAPAEPRDAQPVAPTPAPPRPPRKRRRFFSLGVETNLSSFFIGFILALVPGVAGTLWAITYLADNVSQLVNIALLAILVTSLLGTLLVLLQGRLFRWIGLSVRVRLADVARPVHDAMVAAADGDALAVADSLRVAAERTASWYSWFAVRRWIVGVTVVLLAAFAALIGTALLHEQNRLIARQNEYFQSQNAYLQQQIELAEREGRLARRSQLVATLFERAECEVEPCPPSASLRARAEAFRVLVQLDDQDIAWSADVLTRDYAGVDLRWADLDGLDLRGVSLRGADLRGARLTGVDLGGANLANAALSGADLRAADLEGARLVGADLRGANLYRATLADGALEHALVDANTRLPDAPAALGNVECAMCCAAFTLGRSAAASYGTGTSTSEADAALVEDLHLLGLTLPTGPRRASGGRSFDALFHLDASGAELWARARRLVVPLGAARPEVVEAFQLGVYLAYMSANADKRRFFDAAVPVRILRVIVGSERAEEVGLAAPTNARADLGPFTAAVGRSLGCAVE